MLEAEVAVSLFTEAFPRAQVVGDINEYAGPTFIGNDLLALPMRLDPGDKDVLQSARSRRTRRANHP